MSAWPIYVVPNPLDLSVFSPGSRVGARRRLGLPSESQIILCGAVGAVSDPRKGLDLLLGALRMLPPDPSRLGAIFGEEEPKDPPRVGFRLHWMGRIDRDEDLADLYRAADVMVVPSRQENLPQTGTEAQACGTPVVAFDAAGMPDVVKHGTTGFLAEPFSVESLAAAITWVTQDQQRRAQLGAAARARAVRLWNPDDIAAKYCEIYAAAIAR
jgi:glycosyltransferase involved in cell wall biosynthesis